MGIVEQYYIDLRNLITGQSVIYAFIVTLFTVSTIKMSQPIMYKK